MTAMTQPTRAGEQMHLRQTRSPHRVSPWLLAMAVMGLLVCVPTGAPAQVPARFYWKTLSGSSAVPLIFLSLNGNSNPLDPAHLALPGGVVEATVAPVGYARTFVLFDRAAMAAALMPMGRISGDVTAFGNTVHETASGFGDPLLELDVNVVGKKPIRSLPELLRYEPGFSLDLLVDVALPVGEYDAEQALNLGQNRWYGRIGAPIVWQLGAWVPGRRTTLEFLPSLWLFGDNSDYVGQTLATEPLFELEGHLTRDLTKDLWVSLDGTWYTGGTPSIDGVEGSALDNLGLGYTLGYTVNANIQATLGYGATINDNEPGDLQMDGFRASVVFGWHPLIEGVKRLGSEH
ncbi:MAG TPA: transporter [Gemmatimonadales bacterium]|nr:transporter [Gemmatimonadales bacterium]HRZ10294.1 transporter [Gemmatimonadales bacterium]